jgi:hypothetical protein
VVAALAVAAAIFALLALITGLAALYVRLEPAYGVFQALGIVAGVLAVIELVLVSAAMIVARGRTSSRRVIQNRLNLARIPLNFAYSGNFVRSSRIRTV